MAVAPVARTAVQASRENDAQVDNDPHHVPAPKAAEPLGPSRKRKTSDFPTTKQNGQRQKITRACDHCKTKKTRCTGTLPCVRCTRLSLPCEYSAAYSRGLPPAPLPAPQSSGTRNPSASRVPLAACGSGTPATQRSMSDALAPSHRAIPGRDPGISPRNSPEPVATDFEGNYLGPASGISFINRIWRRLHQDETSALPEDLANESSKNASVFMFGDKPYTNYQDHDFILPPFDKAIELVGIYFDFSMVTYRFLHRGSVEQWLSQVYESNVSFSNPPSGAMVARTAVILMIFSVATLYEELDPYTGTDGRDKRYVTTWFGLIYLC